MKKILFSFLIGGSFLYGQTPPLPPPLPPLPPKYVPTYTPLPNRGLPPNSLLPNNKIIKKYNDRMVVLYEWNNIGNRKYKIYCSDDQTNWDQIVYSTNTSLNVVHVDYGYFKGASSRPNKSSYRLQIQ